MKDHVAAVDRQESRVWKESRDLKERKEKSWIVQCHRPTGNSVWKNLDDGRDSGKIKVQKYPENAIKNKLICRGHIWRRLSRNAAKYIN